MMSRNIYHVKLAAKSLSVATALLVGCWCWSVSAWAADSPLEMIRSTTNQALAVLANPSEQGKEQRQQQIERMWESVLPRFDTDEIAKRSLGVHWQTLTEDQKKELQEVRMSAREQLQGLGDLSREERGKKVAEVQADINKKILTKLTPDQQKQLDDLKGEKVDVDMSQLRGGPGGRGERGERGERRGDRNRGDRDRGDRESKGDN